MAYSPTGFLDQYKNLNTIPALAGILFAVSAAVQFLNATVSVAPSADLAYSFAGTDALLVGIVSLLVAFASSESRDFTYLETWEQAAVAVTVAVMVGMEYTTEVADIMANNQPASGIVAFLVGMVAWGILAQ